MVKRSLAHDPGPARTALAESRVQTAHVQGRLEASTHAAIDACRHDPEIMRQVKQLAKQEGVPTREVMNRIIANSHAIADHPGGPPVPDLDPKPEPTGPVSPQLKRFRELLK